MRNSFYTQMAIGGAVLGFAACGPPCAVGGAGVGLAAGGLFWSKRSIPSNECQVLQNIFQMADLDQDGR